MAEEYTSGFYIRIYSYQTGGRDKKDSMSVGHFSIELMRPDGTSENYGFYPSGNPILSKGQLTNDAIKKAGFTDRLTSNAIPITSTEAQKVDKVFQKIKNDPSLYFVAGNNCQELLDTVLKESGIKAKSEDFLSEKQWGQFNLAKFGMSRPQHQSYQERTAPNHSSRPGQVDKTPSEPLSEAEFRKIMADHEMGRVLGDPSFREKAGDNLLPIVKGRENFEAQKKQMNEQSEFLRQRENQDSLEQSREAAEAAGVDNQRHELQPMDFETREEYERYRAQLRGSETEQKQPAADAADDAGREAGPDQRSDAGDASQQQQFAAANADSAIDTGGIDTGGIDTGSIDTGSIDTGGGNNGRNYAAELAALPLGREVSLNWLLEKSPDQWTQPELDDAQASDAYWNSRNPRHADVQNAVSDVYRYLYGNGSQSFRPDGSLPRAEPINALRGNTFRGNIQADADYLKDARTLPHIPSEDDDRYKRTLPYIPSEDDADAATPLGRADSPRQSQRQNRLADLGRLMEDIPPFDGSEAARTAPGRYLQQAINTLLWPGKAAPDAASIQAKPYRNGPILVDGEIGPITIQALDRVEAMPDGLSELTYDLKRQAAQDIVQRVTPEMPADDLAYQLDGAVNIFRDLNRSHDGSVRQLQKGLNQLGRQSMGQQSTGLDETWQPIAEDGQLGPVTAKSFATLAKRLPADSMASLFDLGTPPSVGAAGNRKAKAASQMPQLSARDPNPRQRLRTGML